VWTSAGRRKAAKKRKGKHLSSKTRSKISRSLKGKKHPHKGHKVSAATRKKLSKALKGRKHPHKGHKASAAARKKISAKLKGRHHKGHKTSAATRAKLSKALKGKKHPHKGAHVHHKVTHRRHSSSRVSRHVTKRTGTYRRFVRIGHRHRMFQKFGRGHVHGRTNLQVVSKASGHRIVPQRMRISNQTLLQNKLGRRLLPAIHGRTNRRLILGALHRRRRRP
jgi:hypothetical protein